MLMHRPSPPAQMVTMTQVSKGSTTIAGEPELYLNSPNAEITSAIFTIPPGTKTQWMTHPAPGYIYVLQGTLTVQFADGSLQTFSAGQAFLQARTKWHRGWNRGSQSVRFLVVFFGAKGVPDVMHPPAGDLVEQGK
jgi:quercetin dioxygenase-like cupin family protein